MWTRLVAGAAAHDINNLAQGLSNLLSLASTPTATRASRWIATAPLRATVSRAISASWASNLRSPRERGSGAETQRLDLLAAEARVRRHDLETHAIDSGPSSQRPGRRGRARRWLGPRAAARDPVPPALRRRRERAARARRGERLTRRAERRPRRRGADSAVTAGDRRGRARRAARRSRARVRRRRGPRHRRRRGSPSSAGRATAASASGGGLRFKLSLPRAEERQQDEGSRDGRTT